MRVLDATFLIDYLDGTEETAEYLSEHGDERFVVPAPAYAEVLVEMGNLSTADVTEGISALAWGDVEPVDERSAEVAASIADAIGPQGPNLSGADGLIAAVGPGLDAPVVSSDSDLTHPETRQVVAVDAYRV